MPPGIAQGLPAQPHPPLPRNAGEVARAHLDLLRREPAQRRHEKIDFLEAAAGCGDGGGRARDLCKKHPAPSVSETSETSERSETSETVRTARRTCPCHVVAGKNETGLGTAGNTLAGGPEAAHKHRCYTDSLRETAPFHSGFDRASRSVGGRVDPGGDRIFHPARFYAHVRRCRQPPEGCGACWQARPSLSLDALAEFAVSGAGGPEGKGSAGPLVDRLLSFL